jgi:hypothetical protein
MGNTAVNEQQSMSVFGYELNTNTSDLSYKGKKIDKLYTINDNISFIITLDDYDYVCIKGMECTELNNMLKIAKSKIKK